MSEINATRLGLLVRGAFQILLDHPEGLPAKQILERLPSLVPMTEFESSTYPDRPNVRRYEKIVRFATIAPVKAGWLTKDSGTWALTDDGRSAFKRFTDPEQFTREVRNLYYKWRAQQPDAELPESEEQVANAAITLENAAADAWREVESYVTAMLPYDFQKLVADLLRGMAYHVEWEAPPGPDKGIDVIAHADPIGVTGPTIKVQVKRSGAMPVDEVRSFLAVLGDRDIGLFVSSGGFTKDAHDLARTQEKRRLMLVDLKKFFDLWVRHYDQIPQRSRRLLPIKPVWFLAPSGFEGE